MTLISTAGINIYKEFDAKYSQFFIRHGCHNDLCMINAIFLYIYYIENVI